jgi:hypothetical protein
MFTFVFGRQKPVIEIPMDHIPMGLGPDEPFDIRVRKNKARRVEWDKPFTVEVGGSDEA